ncbi:hypothetical protein D039_0201B, partial [Vibrio parahaemolyticus EKP-028]
TAKRLNQ